VDGVKRTCMLQLCDARWTAQLDQEKQTGMRHKEQRKCLFLQIFSIHYLVPGNLPWANDTAEEHLQFLQITLGTTKHHQSETIALPQSKYCLGFNITWFLVKLARS
jgi:hypothetical protein